jgi:hypothetical protein
MESKYFIPDKEDIHIGYECEYCDNYGFETFNLGKDNWIPIKIKLQEEDGAYTSEIEDILIGMDDGYQPIRVPYLTKEQIEGEGWTSFITEYDNKISLEKMNYVFFREDKNYMLGWYFNTNQIALLIKDPSLVEDYYSAPTFRGECKDINTFRTICKLLNI